MQKDTLSPTVPDPDLSAHTPMMQQYQRMTFHWEISIGKASRPIEKSVNQSPSSAPAKPW